MTILLPNMTNTKAQRVCRASKTSVSYVRRPDGIRRYCHLATAGIYSDAGLFTCRESFGEDLTELFNLLTGYTRPQKFQHLFFAPMDLREHFISCIRREADRGRAGQTARIIAKVNSLIDPAMIEELYLASQAGVQIDLIVRGMCSLRPGVEGLSERIRVCRSSIATLNTRAFSISTTTASRSICFRLPTGCNAISTIASKLPFRCSMNSTKPSSKKF